MSTIDIHIERRELPPIPEVGDREIDDWAVYARVTSGCIEAVIERWIYWHPGDRHPVDVRFEARIHGLPDHAGTADVWAQEPDLLHTLAGVCTHTAVLLQECQRQSSVRSVVS